MSERIPVTVELDSDDLRAWADRHADAGHHGVAHALYQAANGVESITEQHDRETAARAWDEGFEEPRECCGLCPLRSCPWDNGGDGPTNPYRKEADRD